MAHQVCWNKIIVEEFVEEAMLSADEEFIIRARAAGWNRQRQADALGMSVDNVDKITKKLKKKYDAVAEYDPLLPTRLKTPDYLK